MTEKPSNSILGLVKKIARQHGEFELHLISYYDEIRRVLKEDLGRLEIVLTRLENKLLKKDLH